MKCYAPQTDMVVQVFNGVLYARPCCYVPVCPSAAPDSQKAGLAECFNAPLMRNMRRDLLTHFPTECQQYCRTPVNIRLKEPVGRDGDRLAETNGLWKWLRHRRGPSDAFLENLRQLRSESEETTVPSGAYPVYIVLDGIDSRCNQSCHFCSQRRIRSRLGPIPKHILEEVVSRHERLGIIAVVGGEPFFSPGCLAFWRMCREANVHFLFATSTNANIVPDWIADFTFSGICCTVCAVTRNTFENVHIGGNYENVLRNVRKLAKMRDMQGNIACLTLNFNVCNRNFHEIIPAIDLFETDMGVLLNFREAIFPPDMQHESLFATTPAVDNDRKIELLECAARRTVSEITRGQLRELRDAFQEKITLQS